MIFLQDRSGNIQFSQSLLWRRFLLVVGGVDIVCFSGEVASTKMNFSWKGELLEFLFNQYGAFANVAR